MKPRLSFSLVQAAGMMALAGPLPDRSQRVTRYAVTTVKSDGLRVLAFANQGRCHFDTKDGAEKHLAAILANNSESTLASTFGQNFRTTMRVDPVECYDHGDAVRTVFGYEPENDPGLTPEEVERVQAEPDEDKRHIAALLIKQNKKGS